MSSYLSANGELRFANETIIFTLQVGSSSVIGKMMIFGSTKRAFLRRPHSTFVDGNHNICGRGREGKNPKSVGTFLLKSQGPFRFLGCTFCHLE
jgi:hypothetical protein